MKNLISILALTLLVFGCGANKELTTSPSSQEAKSGIKNIFSTVCECKNSNGVTIEEYGVEQSQKSNLSPEAYAQTIPDMIKNPENWLFKEFFQDEKFLANVESQVKDYTFQDTPDELEELKHETMKKYPVCWALIPYMAMVVNSKK